MVQRNGTPGGDDLDGTSDGDIFAGNAGDDTIDGNSGNDLLLGGKGNDDISGGGDNDTVCGGRGNDSITGGNGQDVLEGGFGRDTLNGGNESDTFRFIARTVDEVDIVEDFVASDSDNTQLDNIQLKGFRESAGVEVIVNPGGNGNDNDLLLRAVNDKTGELVDVALFEGVNFEDDVSIQEFIADIAFI